MTWEELDRTNFPELRANLQTTGAVLSEELLTAAYEVWLRSTGMPSPHTHLVGTAAVRRGGWTMCRACLGPVYLGEPRGL